LAGDIDPALRAYLRRWRRATAQRYGIAASSVMYDSSLDGLCRKFPGSLTEIRQVVGFSKRKTEMYGPQILEALREFRKEARTAHQSSD
jgi:ATP-dependent DNA helicase RecQ